MNGPRGCRRALPTAGAAAAVLALAGVLAGCQADFGAPRGATTQGKDTFDLWQGAVIAALVVGAIVWALIFYVIIRYRARGDDAVPSQRQYIVWLEVAYTLVPVLIVAGLFYFTVTTQDRVTSVSANPTVKVDVTAFQWGWRFQYHDTPVTLSTQGNSTPTLVLPAGRTTRITLVSADVVHSFYVTDFLFKRDAVPGIVNTFDLTPVHNGTFSGRCSAFCGLRHTDMRFDVSVLSPGDFDRWLSDQSARAAS